MNLLISTSLVILAIFPSCALSQLLNGKNQIVWAANRKFCIHKMHGGDYNGNPLHLWKCRDGTHNEQFLYDSESGLIKVKNAQSFCFHKMHGNTRNGNPIHIWKCDVGSVGNKQWDFDEKQGLIRLRANRNKCIHIKRSSATNGNALHLWDCLEMNGNDMWGQSDKKVSLLNNLHQIQRLTNQAFCIHKVHDKFYNGNPIHLWKCGITGSSYTAENEAWLMLSNGTIVAYRNKNYCMQRKYSSVANGTPIHLWRCGKDEANESFLYDGATGQIRLEADPSKCIHVKNRNSQNGNPVQLYDCLGNGLDQWGTLV